MSLNPEAEADLAFCLTLDTCPELARRYAMNQAFFLTDSLGTKRHVPTSHWLRLTHVGVDGEGEPPPTLLGEGSGEEGIDSTPTCVFGNFLMTISHHKWYLMSLSTCDI